MDEIALDRCGHAVERRARSGETNPLQAGVTPAACS
jgi:hypothetical protein